MPIGIIGTIPPQRKMTAGAVRKFFVREQDDRDHLLFGIKFFNISLRLGLGTTSGILLSMAAIGIELKEIMLRYGGTRAPLRRGRPRAIVVQVNALIIRCPVNP